MGKWSTVRALAHRNYRLFFFGQSISLIGTWIQRTALIWLVYRVTNSPLLPGVLIFLTQIPTFFFSPLFGVLTDRWNRHRTVLLVQILAAIQSLVLLLLDLAGILSIPAILGLSLALGLINALDMPSRQAFLVEMIDERQDLGNAIALNSSMVNGARLIGPATAGILIAAIGEYWCFLLNVLSFIPVIAALLAMRIAPVVKPSRGSGVWEDLREGFAYAFGFPPVRDILLLLALVSFGGMPLIVLMPVFARQVLHGHAETFGLLSTVLGAGALAGGLTLAARRSVLGLGRQIAWAAAVFGVALIGLALSASLPVSCAVLFVAGFAMIYQMAASNTVLQTIVEEDKRGRVMSFYAMAFRGTAPFGSLLAGGLATYLGAPLTVCLGAGACLLGALLFALRLPSLRELIRPIYQEAGILPQPSPDEPDSNLTFPRDG